MNTTTSRTNRFIRIVSLVALVVFTIIVTRFVDFNIPPAELGASLLSAVPITATVITIVLVSLFLTIWWPKKWSSDRRMLTTVVVLVAFIILLIVVGTESLRAVFLTAPLDIIAYTVVTLAIAAVLFKLSLTGRLWRRKPKNNVDTISWEEMNAAQNADSIPTKQMDFTHVSQTPPPLPGKAPAKQAEPQPA